MSKITIELRWASQQQGERPRLASLAVPISESLPGTRLHLCLRDSHEVILSTPSHSLPRAQHTPAEEQRPDARPRPARRRAIFFCPNASDLEDRHSLRTSLSYREDGLAPLVEQSHPEPMRNPNPCRVQGKASCPLRNCRGPALPRH